MEGNKQQHHHEGGFSPNIPKRLHQEDWLLHWGSSALPGLDTHLLHLSFTQCDALFIYCN